MTHIIDGTSLDDRLLIRWDAIQRGNPVLDNPFLRPEFTQAVASVRSDVEVAVLEEDGEVCGFFPFQRSCRNAGTPVGGHLSNCQALIVAENQDWDILTLLADCKLSSWSFDNLIASQTFFQRFHHLAEPSGFLDLSAGYDAYVEERRKSGSKSFKNVLRKHRKLQRDAGECRFELHTDSLEILQTLLDWKTLQCKEGKSFNAFNVDWCIALLIRLLTQHSEYFGPMLSVFYIGDEPAAIDYDLVSDSAADGWLTVYNPKFYRHSPGQIATLQKAEQYAARGIRRFYLGRGGGFHKKRLVSANVMLAEGSVDRVFVRSALRRTWTSTREWLRSSPFRNPARRIKRLLEPLESHRLRSVKTKLPTHLNISTPGSHNE